MVDLSIIYSKTGKGLRARKAADAGLTSKQLKMLSFVDGKSKAEEILTKSNDFTEKELAATLSQLETTGFIRSFTSAQSSVEEWALTSNFTPMVVEEFKSEDEIEAEAQAKVAQEKLDAERIAADKAQEKIRWKAEINARKAAVTKEKSRLEQERVAREAALAQKKMQYEHKKRDDEIRAKAKQQAELLEQAKLKADVQAKAENEAKLEALRKAKAELKAQEAAEQETKRVRLETERQHKAEQAQLQLERIAKAENDAQLEAIRKTKAELKAQEAAEHQRLQLAEKKQAEDDSKAAARLEMARVVGKAEEARKLAESQAKEARQEAKRKIKAEEQARVKSARAAKDDAELARVAVVQAEQKKIALQQAVQLEMQRFTLGTAETKSNAEASMQAEQARLLAIPITDQQASLNAEDAPPITTQQINKEAIEQQLVAQQAQDKAEQVRAKNEAEQQVALEAKELAKQEMARIAREADALRSQADNPSVTKPIKSGRFEASRTAKLKKSTIQADKNAKNAADMQAREAEKRAYIATIEQQAATKHQEDTKPPIKIKRMPIDLNSVVLNCLKWLAKLFKTTLIVGVLLALLLIGVLHFVNISPLIAPIEKLAANSLGSPVHIQQVRASLWPQPHLVLREVAVGDVLKATSVQVIPEYTALFDDVKRVKSLQIQGLVIEPSNGHAALQLIQQLGKTPSLKVEQLKLSDLSFKLKDLVLGPFDGNLALNKAGALNSVDLTSSDLTGSDLNSTGLNANAHALTAKIKPQGEDYAITLTGVNWPLPLNPKIVFNELQANANIHQNQMTFSQIDGAMFGGNIHAKAVLDWSSDWRTTGNFTLTNANAPQLLQAFASKANVEGKVNIIGDFASQSAEALKLADAPTITANIALKNGKINGVDLAHAVMFNQSASLAGEATAFDTLNANLLIKNGQYSYKQITLDTKQFHARGNVEIAQNQALFGNVTAALTAQSRRLQASFGLAGTLSNVKRQ